MKKRLLTMILVFAMVMGLAGCGTKNNSKIEISMYLWDKNMTRELTPWLEKKFPDIEFTFVSGFNSMDYYSYLNQKSHFCLHIALSCLWLHLIKTVRLIC